MIRKIRNHELLLGYCLRHHSSSKRQVYCREEQVQAKQSQRTSDSRVPSIIRRILLFGDDHWKRPPVQGDYEGSEVLARRSSNEEGLRQEINARAVPFNRLLPHRYM